MTEQPSENYAMDVHATNKPLLDVQDIPKSIVDPSLPKEAQEKLQNIQEILDHFKKKLLEKFEGYIAGVALLPPSKPNPEKPDEQPNPDDINALVLIDDTDAKKMTPEELKEKLSTVIDEMAKGIDANLKPETLLYSEVWQHCYDAKYEILQTIALSAPVYDNGMLAAIKISEVHKNMVLKKFEKYIVSYVLAGSLVQGKATPISDIDVYIVIDDTDVKKMTRYELRERLRQIIARMSLEASEITGIKNKMNIQTYILTDFWDSVKDAHPVIFTFLRDGVPFFDRGIFMPWKQLLKMGRIKPSIEAIDSYLSSGEQYLDRVQAKLKEIGIEDFFWSVLTPSQAVIMMHGVPPPTPKEAPNVLREIFVKKEKLLEDKYVKILERVLKTRKDLEHGTKTTISGKEIDDLHEQSKDFLKRINDLANEIEQKSEGKTVLHIYDSIVTIMRDILRLEGHETLEEGKLLAMFDKHIIEKGLIAKKYGRILKLVFDNKTHFEKGEMSKIDVLKSRKDSGELTRVLVEYVQRKRSTELERSKVRVQYADKIGEILLLNDAAYVIYDAHNNPSVGKTHLTAEGRLTNITESSLEELEHAVAQAQTPQALTLKDTFFEDLKSIFGEDVHIILR